MMGLISRTFISKSLNAFNFRVLFRSFTVPIILEPETCLSKEENQTLSITTTTNQTEAKTRPP